MSVAAEAGKTCGGNDRWRAGPLGVEEGSACLGAGREGAEGDDGLLRREEGGAGGCCLREGGERAEDEGREEGGRDIHGC